MIEAGGTATLICRATHKNQDFIDQKSLSYRWFKDDIELRSEKKQVLKRTLFNREDEGKYRCRVTSGCSCRWWSSFDKDSKPYQLKMKSE